MRASLFLFSALVSATLMPPPAPAATPTPAVATSSSASQDSIVIQPGDGKTLTDAAGNAFIITANGSVMENGGWAAGGGGTSAMAIANGSVYGQDAKSGRWYTWNERGWWVSSAAPPQASQPAVGPSTPSLETLPPTAAAPVAAPATPIVASRLVCGASTDAGTGHFQILDGHIIDPHGNVFVARGLNAYANADPNEILAQFPGLNFVRLPVPDRASPESLKNFVQTLTDHGVVVEIEDHPWPLVNAYTGSDLAQEASWYASVASAFKDNPYVWFGSQNEPQWDGRANITAEQAAVYNAVRGAGNSSVIMMESGVGGGDPGSVGAGVLDPSAYANMTNIAWDLHFYGWVLDDSNTSQGYADAQLLGQATPTGQGAGAGTGILGAQGIRSRDGTVPVIVGEFGVSTEANQAEGDRVINAVVQASQDGQIQGFAGWGWDPTPEEALVQNGSLTRWGQILSMAVANDCKSEAVPASRPSPAIAGTGQIVPQNSLSFISDPAWLQANPYAASVEHQK